jgi:hypothetical protein
VAEPGAADCGGADQEHGAGDVHRSDADPVSEQAAEAE